MKWPEDWGEQTAVLCFDRTHSVSLGRVALKVSSWRADFRPVLYEMTGLFGAGVAFSYVFVGGFFGEGYT